MIILNDIISNPVKQEKMLKVIKEYNINQIFFIRCRITRFGDYITGHKIEEPEKLLELMMKYNHWIITDRHLKIFVSSSKDILDEFDTYYYNNYKYYKILNYIVDPYGDVLFFPSPKGKHGLIEFTFNVYRYKKDEYDKISKILSKNNNDNESIIIDQLRKFRKDLIVAYMNAYYGHYSIEELYKLSREDIIKKLLYLNSQDIYR